MSSSVEINDNGFRIISLDDNPTIPRTAALVAAGVLTLFSDLDAMSDDDIEASIAEMIRTINDLFAATSRVDERAFITALVTGDATIILRSMLLEGWREQ